MIRLLLMNHPMRGKKYYKEIKSKNRATYCAVHCDIMPPFIFNAIIENGNEDQRKSAIAALVASDRFRTMRELAGTQVVGARSSTLLISAVHEKDRTIYDAHNINSIGTIVRHEGGPKTGDVGADEAYDYAGITYDFYKEVFGRNSIDNNGLKLDSTVHYREDEEEPYENASWGDGRMWYGDGHPERSNRFTIDLAIIGHELSHGVVQYEGGLKYQKDTGAINEHFADVFGILVKQYHLKESVEESNWLIGEGLWKENIVNGKALRSMKEPGTAYGPDPVIGKDPQPAHMSNYRDFGTCVSARACDYGGVHINSGILNKAFYNTAIEIGGYAWEAPGQIWYTALVNLPNNPDRTTFEDLANTTFAEAGKIYGSDSKQQEAVYKGWKDVGIEVTRGNAANFLLSKGVRTISAPS
jgi:Zn-dependent metalloprotease